MITPIPLYVINLEKDVERWSSALLESKDLPFETERIDAINAKDLIYHHLVSSGVNAAWLSHLKAMQTFLDSGQEFCLIAEDDFHIENQRKLMKMLASLENKQWDFVQFGFLKPGIDTILKIAFANTENLVFKTLGKFSQLKRLSRLPFASRMRVKQSLSTPHGFVIDDCQPGAHFYLVRRTFCESILMINNPQFLSIDDFFTALSRMRTFKMLRVKKSLVSQKPFAAWAGPRFKREI